MNIEEASKLLSVIADTNRLKIVVYLRNKLHANASELLKVVDCKQATLSHHLAELVSSGLLNSKKKGNQVIFSLNAPKYLQICNYFQPIDRINKTQEPKQEPKEEVYRVVDSDLINKKPVKNSVPDYLL